MLYPWAKVWPATSRDLACAARSQHYLLGPLVSFGPELSGLVLLPWGVLSRLVPEAGATAATHSRPICKLVRSTSIARDSPLWIWTAQRGLNVAEQSPSFAFPGLWDALPRPPPRGRLGRQVPGIRGRWSTKRAWELPIPESTARAPALGRGFCWAMWFAKHLSLREKSFPWVDFPQEVLSLRGLPGICWSS